MTTRSWKDRATFLTKSEPTVSKIGDSEVKFYPSSVGMVLKLKGLVQPITESLGMLFISTRDDSGNTVRDYKTQGNEIITNPVTPEQSAARVKHRREAIEKLFTSLTDDNLSALGDLIVDSVKEIFPRGHQDNPPGKEFVSALDLPTLTEMLVAVAKANRGILGPLGGRLTAAYDQMTAAVESKVEEITARAGTTTPAPTGAKGPRLAKP